ncbi:TraB/GumN family protein [Vibrio sp. 11986-1-5]|uniref:TraB/GumN family protein n=1 Tax=Vibrio sp. 11986-1-5 TaxID=2211215 RepID=UPI00215B1D35|nr:TraB/GumN family protein [Vibrio sp. 11986-1-5]
MNAILLNSRLLSYLALFFALGLHAEPLHWQATKGNLSFDIVGSIHVGKSSMYPLSSTLYERLVTSNGLIIEVDLSNSQAVTYPPPSVTSQQVLTTQQYRQLVNAAQLLKQDINRLAKLPPWSTALQLQFLHLQQLGYFAEQGVDLHFIRQAEQIGIALLPLETVQYQIDVLTNLPNDGQELLIALLDEWENQHGITECLIESWQRGDSVKLEQLLKQTEMSAEMEDSLITKRNHQWVDKLISPDFLPSLSGHYLVVVGTLHLVGKDSVLTLLQDQGFDVIQRNQSQQATCFPAKQ